MNKHDEKRRLKEAIDPRFQPFVGCHENRKERSVSPLEKEVDGFSEYLSKYLSKYLERTLIEIEPPAKKIKHYYKDTGVFLFSSSSQRIVNEIEDNETKIHNYNSKRKKYDSSDSESEIKKIQESAVSSEWLLKYSAIHKTLNGEENIKHHISNTVSTTTGDTLTKCETKKAKKYE